MSLPSISTSLNDAITLHYLTDRDREELAHHLDIESAWKFVAEVLELQTREITWILNRETRRGSETLLFLDDLERKGVTLKRFMQAVNDSNYKVLPVIDFLNRRYPEIEKKYHQEHVQFSRSIPGNHSESHFRLETSPFQKCKSKTHVLLAHHDEDTRLMINVVNCLKKNGFVVSVNKKEQLKKDSISATNRNLASIQQIFDAADYTLLLVSPSFLKDIIEHSHLTIDDSSPNANSLNIIKMVKALVERNAKKAGHFIIILVKGAKATDVPAWLTSVKTYVWPENYEDLLFFMTDAREVIKKFLERRSANSHSIGRMSRHRCHRCSCNDRCSSHST